MKKIVTTSTLLVIIILFAACNFFTTSWGTGLQRDGANNLSKESASGLAALLFDPAYLSDPEAMATLLEALGNKTPAEIQALTMEEKQAILDTFVSQSLPINVLAELANTLNNGEPSSSDTFTDLISNTTIMDTVAIEAVLTDKETLKNADPSTITTATLVVVLQVAKQETEDAEDPESAADDFLSDIMDEIADSPEGSTPEQVVDQMVTNGSITEESRDQMIAVTRAVQVISGTSPDGIDRSDDLEGTSVAGVDITALLT